MKQGYEPMRAEPDSSPPSFSSTAEETNGATVNDGLSVNFLTQKLLGKREKIPRTFLIGNFPIFYLFLIFVIDIAFPSINLNRNRYCGRTFNEKYGLVLIRFFLP